MATSVGAILCVGLLVLATVILLAMAIASAFIVFPAGDDPFPTALDAPVLPIMTSPTRRTVAVDSSLRISSRTLAGKCEIAG